MKKRISGILILFVGASLFAQQNKHIIPDISESDIRASWKTMHETKARALREMNEAKFGMFIHWGLYSKLAGEYNNAHVPGLAEWIMYHAMIPKKVYGNIANTFNPTKFDAEEWVLTAKNAGMKYIVITAKHHDGFSMYESEHSEFDIKDATPYPKDPIDKLYYACKKHGLRFGLYYSQIIDWWDGWDGGMVNADRASNGLNKSNPMNTWDRNETTRERYLTEKAIPQVKELITKYPDMMQVWFDYWYTGKADRYNTPQISYAFYKVLYDISPTCLVSTRIGCDLGDYKQGGDNIIIDDENIEYWETPGTVNNTWGYSKFDNGWKTPEELIFWIVDIAGKGGNYLLNVGPKADGTIPAQSVELLKEVGQWMKINGEAIYGTKRWKVDREGPNRIKMKGTTNRKKEGFNVNFTSEDVWFTAKENNVYVISLVVPESNKTRIKSMADMEGQIDSISLLGCDEKPTWKKVNGAIEVTLPPKGRLSLNRGFVLKVSTTE